LQALKLPFQLNRTDRTGRPYSVISYGRIKEQGESKSVVLKTYRRINETTVEKVAQVVTPASLDSKEGTHDDLPVHLSRSQPPGLSPSINMFHGVFFADFALLPESLPSVLSIVVDFAKYDSREYLAGKGFGVRLDIVSYS
jgi:hypothetical protein